MKKFRAWWVEQEVMCDVDVIGFSEGAITVSNENTTYKHLGLDEVELMQYTGLKDKNGVEIFEGDITKLGEGGAYHLCVVEFKNDELCYQLTNRKTTGEYIGELLFVRGKGIAECEVIGTLYENPELLEVAE